MFSIIAISHLSVTLLVSALTVPCTPLTRDVSFGTKSCIRSSRTRTKHWCPSESMRPQCLLCVATKDDINDRKSSTAVTNEFWQNQKALAEQLQTSVSTSLKQEQEAAYKEKSNALLGDTAYFTLIIACGLWLVFDNPWVAGSYSLGAVFGLFYAYGLSQYVQSIGGENMNTSEGSTGSARFALLVLLIFLVGKFRSVGLLEIPTITGFFTYQVAAFRQGIKDMDE
jgi:hypothetical protein